MDTTKTTNIPKNGVDRITNELIFKGGFYYLTIKVVELKSPAQVIDCYVIVPDEWAIYNGFEFASDAYKYKAELADREKIE